MEGIMEGEIKCAYTRFCRYLKFFDQLICRLIIAFKSILRSAIDDGNIVRNCLRLLLHSPLETSLFSSPLSRTSLWSMSIQAVLEIGIAKLQYSVRSSFTMPTTYTRPVNNAIKPNIKLLKMSFYLSTSY
jgi:hypothetical protein